MQRSPSGSFWRSLKCASDWIFPAATAILPTAPCRPSKAANRCRRPACWPRAPAKRGSRPLDPFPGSLRGLEPRAGSSPGSRRPSSGEQLRWSIDRQKSRTSHCRVRRCRPGRTSDVRALSVSERQPVSRPGPQRPQGAPVAATTRRSAVGACLIMPRAGRSIMDYWHCALAVLARAGPQRFVQARQVVRRWPMRPVIRPGLHHRTVDRQHRCSAPGRRATTVPEPRCRSPTSASLYPRPLPWRSWSTPLAPLQNRRPVRGRYPPLVIEPNHDTRTKSAECPSQINKASETR